MHKTKEKNQLWNPGDYFSIPLSDGTYALGQVISLEKGALNSAVCSFFARRQNAPFEEISPPLNKADLLSVQFVTRELLDSGVWRVFANGQGVEISEYVNLSLARSKRYIGVKIRGSGVLRRFMNAYYGLEPWDGPHDPQYFENLLISPDKKPPIVH